MLDIQLIKETVAR